MTRHDQLTAIASTLSETRLAELLDFAQFLRFQEERNELRAAGQAQFAKAYGHGEPDYTEADLKVARP